MNLLPCSRTTDSLGWFHLSEWESDKNRSIWWSLVGMSLGLGSVCVFEPVPLKQKGTYLVRTPVSYPVYFFFFFFFLKRAFLCQFQQSNESRLSCGLYLVCFSLTLNKLEPLTLLCGSCKFAFLFLLCLQSNWVKNPQHLVFVFFFHLRDIGLWNIW